MILNNKIKRQREDYVLQRKRKGASNNRVQNRPVTNYEKKP
jgi:hypothetical protein